MKLPTFPWLIAWWLCSTSFIAADDNPLSVIVHQVSGAFSPKIDAIHEVSSHIKPGTDIHVSNYTAVVRGRHGQWVRGSAALYSDGRLIVRVGLETDSTAFGIAGNVTVYLKDAKGNVIATAQTARYGIPGKAPGKARRADFTTAPFTFGQDVTRVVTNIDAVPNIEDDTAITPFGIDNFHVDIPLVKVAVALGIALGIIQGNTNTHPHAEPWWTPNEGTTDPTAPSPIKQPGQ